MHIRLLPLDLKIFLQSFLRLFPLDGGTGDKPTGCLPLDTNGSGGNKKSHKNRWLAATAHSLVQLQMQIQLQIEIEISILAPDILEEPQ